MKCVKCGTEFFGYPCPTCERNRLLAEQNRKVEEQNHLLEEQNRQTARLRDEQERQNQQREQQYEREEEQRRQESAERKERELEDQLKSRLAELFKYAEERNLMLFYVYQESIYNKIQMPFSIKKLITFDIRNHELKIIKKLFERFQEEQKEWNKLIDYLKSEDRFLDGVEYGKCWKPEFKLIDIKQIANTHNTDYVIMASDEKKAIFPVSLVSGYASQSGYEGKKVEIGGFGYLMFLHNNEEAEKVIQILSNANKRLISMQKALEKIVSDVISEYTTANPKPVYKGDDFYKEKVKPFHENKEELLLKLEKHPKSIISKIISILPCLPAFPLLKMLYEGFFDLSRSASIIASAVTIVITALLSVNFRTIFGIVTGILALIGTGWLCLEIFYIEGAPLIFLSLIGGLLFGILFSIILGKIDTKVNNDKFKKKNKKIEEEIIRIEEEKQSETESCKRWEQGLIDSFLNRIDNYITN